MRPQDNINQLKSAFFDKAHETFVIFDENLNFVDVNESFLKTLHVTKEQIVGKNITEISPGIEKTARYELYKNTIQNGESYFMDEVRLNPKLGNFVASINCFKLERGLGVAALNITDLKEASEELETLIYKASHDMRSPISSILGLVNLALADSNSSEYYLNMMKKEIERLGSILRILVGTTKVSKGEKSIQSIDFNTIIDEIIRSLSNIGGFGEIRFDLKILLPANFYSDKLLIKSILENLIENSIKYKKWNVNDSFVEVTIKEENEGVRIKVSDNGIGIPESMQKDVFKMFFRGTDKASGVGLGLYAIKYCIKNLNGSITMNSKENVGTVFSIYLPNEILEKEQILN